jgi:hypothetical protein
VVSVSQRNGFLLLKIVTASGASGSYFAHFHPTTTDHNFRTSTDDLFKLAEALKIPETFETTNCYVFSQIEALRLLCARFCSAGEMYTLSMPYDCSQSSISECINELVEYLDNRWEHLLGCDNDHLLHPDNLKQYAHAICTHGAPIRSIFSFINCIIQRICHPTWFQQQAYNAHKKFHSLKFQAVMLPNGIIGHLYSLLEGRTTFS